jgi:nickel-dependent lactate racemase
LQNAAHAVREGGIVIVVSECADGLGSSTFGEWLTSGASPDELLARLADGFVIGGHVAVAMNRVLRRGVRVFLVSELDPSLVRRAKLEPFTRAQEAVDRALDELGSDCSIAVMPHAGSTLPVVSCR